MGAARTVRTVSEGYSYLECPRWHDARLWVSDFYTESVHVVDPADGSSSVVAEVPQQPSGLGFTPDGTTLIVSMRDRRILRRDSGGELAVHADLSGLVGPVLNDMVVDAAGGAYVGNFGFDLMSGAPVASTTLTHVDPAGTASTVADGLFFPNGMVLLDSGRTLVVAETFASRLSAFDVASDGTLSNRRVWAGFGDASDPSATDVGEVLGGLTVAPDGIGADSEGAIWVCDALHQRAIRVREGGEIVDEVSVAPLSTYACTLGGDHGTTLFLCAAPSFLEHERRPVREGVLLAVEVDVPHAGRP